TSSRLLPQVSPNSSKRPAWRTGAPPCMPPNPSSSVTFSSRKCWPSASGHLPWTAATHPPKWLPKGKAGLPHPPASRRSSLPEVQASLHGCTAEWRCSIASSRASRNALLAIAASFRIQYGEVRAILASLQEILYTNWMKSEDYAQGDAFQAEKRTIFSA